MDQKEVFGKVVKIISPYAKDATLLATATNDSKILEDLGVNSARFVDIVLAFEDEFGIEIDDETANTIRTLGDAVTTVTSKMG